MAKPPQKDRFDTIIDFFLGALFGICSMIGLVFHSGDMAALQGRTWLLLFLAANLIGGSLAALARDQFWSKYETYRVIAPIEEGIAKRSRALLWIVFGLGCGVLGLLFL